MSDPKTAEATAPAAIPSTDDRRVTNNTLRHEYRILSEQEKATVTALKDAGQAFLDLVERTGKSRELSLSRTKIEEAVFWAVKHVTA